MRRPPVAALAAAAPLALLPVAPAAAAEQPLTCGTEVTTDVTLAADLVCDDVALVAAGDGITIDLAGHTITARIAVDSGWSPGAFRVVGGTIAGGSFVADTDTTVERMTFVDDATVSCVNGPLTVRDSTFRASKVRGGMYCGDATIERNRFEGSTVDLWLAGGTVRDNTFRGGDPAVSALAGGDITISRNTVSGATTGMDLAGGGYRGGGHLVVEDNVVRGNEAGIRFDAGSAYASAHATIARNRVTGNQGHGIEVLADLSEILGDTDVTVEENRSIRNGGDGIRAEITAERVVIDDPTAPFHELRLAVGRNLAVANGGVGITVPDDEDVVDEGGNRAFANRGGACTGVVCR